MDLSLLDTDILNEVLKQRNPLLFITLPAMQISMGLSNFQPLLGMKLLVAFEKRMLSLNYRSLKTSVSIVPFSM
ncbi:MAG: hypothetical protein ACI9HK_004046 [Pirellulaceae bacterium]|jgi:hypothetical protein